ncbi:hypothetical protein HKCCE2091_10105 [Rhodobacterales bacterium HKCCE2091]|nr:hypothetical protein [Rhodobacterales bacterium HKCCE2091]
MKRMQAGVLSLLLAALLAVGAAADEAPAPRPEPPARAAEEAPVELVAASSEERSAPRVGPETGFPLPRYVSMDAAEGNVRRGPSRSHRIDWVFTRRGMPLVVVAEYGHWRRVVDRDGQGGWMHYALLSGERTAIVETDMVELRQRPDTGAPVRAQAERGVIGRLQECREGWCLISTGGYRGWVPQNALWGTDPGEVIE